MADFTVTAPPASGGYSDHPDKITLIIAAYGKAYPNVVEGNYEIDRMIDHMEEKNARILKRADLRFFDKVISHNILLTRLPDEKLPPAYKQQIIDIRTYLENIEAIEELKFWKVRLDVWGRYRGTIEHCNDMDSRGVPAAVREAASHALNKKEISFGTIKEAMP